MKSLFAAEERESKLSKLGDPLESLGRHVDFAALAASVDRALPRPHRYFGGQPLYPTELMIRLLVIRQLFNLSDTQLEFQVLDRASFQRFLGIRDGGKVPDRNKLSVSTDCRYKLIRTVHVSLTNESEQPRHHVGTRLLVAAASVRHRASARFGRLGFIADQQRAGHRFAKNHGP